MMQRIPTQSAVYTSQQVRDWEKVWFAQHNSSYGLMQQAAWAVAQQIQQRYSMQPLTVWVGAGNNGGDGWQVAAYLQQAGWAVTVCEVAAPNTPDAQQAKQAALAAGVLIQSFEPNTLPVSVEVSRSLSTAIPPTPFEKGGVPSFVKGGLGRIGLDPCNGILLDALFGIGLSRAPDGQIAAAIAAINQAKIAGATVIALDVPSGVQADTGVVWDDCAVQADLTLCLIALKSGLITGEAKNYVGELQILSLIPSLTTLQPMARHITTIPRLPARAVNSHKGTHGHVLLIGGALGMGGAALMAAEAAVRAGAGKISLLTHRDYQVAILARSPNLMSLGVGDDLAELPTVLAERLPQVNSLAIGMGLGRDAWGRQIWHKLLPTLLDATQVAAVVVDADALYHLADTDPATLKGRTAHWHCTPHAGEAARLLGCSVAQIEADRYAAIQQLQARYGGQWLLKGAGSLVLDQRGLSVCGLGNAGMAVGGMGDVLAGLAVGLLAQWSDLPLSDAVCLHAAAGDLAAQCQYGQGQRGMTALDVVEKIREVVNLS